MPAQLAFDVTVRDGRLWLRAAGEIDLSNVDALTRALGDAVAEAARTGAALIVDLAAVDYLDSAAINALYAVADDIAVLVAPPLLLTTLRVSGLADIVAVDPAP
ncbi:STAS domain-containing protein [Mycolicibacterium sp. 018/SC-01/001]|uniref:STAS domain-containing protein n=1 Tax=Mycolicibacterium sp. 018/SC-01/001 TaxID=2592069 RepID=UPI0011810270|nr:STAS domain-containing protein [Mycolicibacterium sp. 018/SC-01/001]TRW81191.1 STAS domain-containing protein [Mycolicibacterium sp. 018/SC-01/001]